MKNEEIIARFQAEIDHALREIEKVKNGERICGYCCDDLFGEDPQASYEQGVLLGFTDDELTEFEALSEQHRTEVGLLNNTNPLTQRPFEDIEDVLTRP